MAKLKPEEISSILAKELEQYGRDLEGREPRHHPAGG